MSGRPLLHKDSVGLVADFLRSQEAENAKPLEQKRAEALDELTRWAKQLSELPEPIAYIVTDSDVPAISHIEDRDKRGRRYLQVHPSIVARVPKAEPRPYGFDAGIALHGIPVIPRESLPEGWPDDG